MNYVCEFVIVLFLYSLIPNIILKSLKFYQVPTNWLHLPHSQIISIKILTYYYFVQGKRLILIYNCMIIEVESVTFTYVFDKCKYIIGVMFLIIKFIL